MGTMGSTGMGGSAGRERGAGCTRRAHRGLRVAVASALCAAALVTLAGPAGAAPANDDYADRAAIGFGDSVAINTAGATSQAVDAQVADACPFPPGPPPAATNTVWFNWRTGASPPPLAAAMVSGAAWPAGVAVATRSPGAFVGVACGPALALFAPAPNTAYRIMVFDFIGAGGGRGTFSLGAPPPPPELGLTIDRTARFDSKTGTPTLTGTYTCEHAYFVDIFGDVQQRAGRAYITGFFSAAGIDCDGEPHRWRAEVTGANGRFAGGKALTVGLGFGCGDLFCSETFVEQTVYLRGGG